MPTEQPTQAAPLPAPARPVEYRVDVIDEPLAAPYRSPDGAVHCEGFAARPGIYEYINADGTTRRELVTEEDLHDPESLATLANAPLTLRHPPEMIVTPESAQRLSHGHVHPEITVRPNDYVGVKFTGRSRPMIDRLDDKTRPARLSPGYALPEFDPTPGHHPRWGRFDARQGRRTYNHLAVVDDARGGPEMAVRIDGYTTAAAIVPHIQEAPMPEQIPQTKTLRIRLDMAGGAPPMEKEVTVAANDAEMISAAMGQQSATIESLRAEMAAKAGELAALQAKISEMEGAATTNGQLMTDAIARADAAEARLKDPVKLREALAPRLKLEEAARRVFPESEHTRIDGLGDEDIQRGILRSLIPSLDKTRVDSMKGVELAAAAEAALAYGQQRTDAAPSIARVDANAPEIGTLPKGTAPAKPQTSGQTTADLQRKRRNDAFETAHGRTPAAKA